MFDPSQNAVAVQFSLQANGTGFEQSLEQAQRIAGRWRTRVLGHVHGGSGEHWLPLVPDIGPSCEAILADQLFHDLCADERKGLLDWIRGNQDISGAWLDSNGEADLSLTVLGWWARVCGGDDRREPSMVCAQRMVQALGGAQRANFEVRLWLALGGQIPWSFLPAIPGELFLLPKVAWLSPSRFAPWARGVLTPYYVLAKGSAHLQLPDAAELLLHKTGDDVIEPRLTRAGLAGDLLQAFDRTVKLSRKLPRGPLPKWAVRKATAWLGTTQQRHGGWFSTRPTLLSLLALRVNGAPSDDERILRGLAQLRRARGLARIPRGTAQGQTALAQGLTASHLGVAARLVRADPNPVDRAALMRLELSERGPWQVRADALTGGWPIEAGAGHHLDLEATCQVLEALTTVPSHSDQSSPSWATTRRATEVVLAMQQPAGGFARFERGESDVFMRRLPWTDADLLAFGHKDDPAHVRVSALALAHLGRTGFREDDDRVGRGIAWLTQVSADEHTDRGIETLGSIADAVTATCNAGHPLRAELERRLRGRQREDGSFGDLVDTARALRGLLKLSGVCVQSHRAARYLATRVGALGDELGSQTKTGTYGFGLSAELEDPSAGAREVSIALQAFTELSR